MFPIANATTSANLRHLISAYYRREALDVLTPIHVFYELCEPDQIPKRNGKTMQWFRYSLFPANTSAHSEDAVGSPLTVDSNILTATIVEYADFIPATSLLVDTAIDDTVSNYAKLLGMRAALSVDTITRTEFDATTSTEGPAQSATYSATDVRGDVSRLKALNVLPKDDGYFRTVCHPYMTYDLMADNTAGGWTEVAKYTEPTRLLSGEIGRIGGSRIMETTNVKTSGSGDTTLYYNYTVGRGAVGAVDLAGSGPSKVRDPQKQMFAIKVIPGGADKSDPEDIIGGIVSYKYRYVVKDMDTTTPRHRKTIADASLV